MLLLIGAALEKKPHQWSPRWSSGQPRTKRYAYSDSIRKEEREGKGREGKERERTSGRQGQPPAHSRHAIHTIQNINDISCYRCQTKLPGTDHLLEVKKEESWSRLVFLIEHMCVLHTSVHRPPNFLFLESLSLTFFRGRFLSRCPVPSTHLMARRRYSDISTPGVMASAIFLSCDSLASSTARSFSSKLAMISSPNSVAAFN